MYLVVLVPLKMAFSINLSEHADSIYFNRDLADYSAKTNPVLAHYADYLGRVSV